MLLRLLPPVVSASLFATLDSSPYFAIGAFVLTLVFGWRAFKVRDFTSEIAALQAALHTAEVVKKTDDERKQQLEEQLRGAQERANASERLVESLREDLSEWRARYDEKAAGTSLQAVEVILKKMIENADHRHEQTIDLMRRLAGEQSVTNPKRPAK